MEKKAPKLKLLNKLRPGPTWTGSSNGHIFTHIGSNQLCDIVSVEMSGFKIYLHFAVTSSHFPPLWLVQLRLHWGPYVPCGHESVHAAPFQTLLQLVSYTDHPCDFSWQCCLLYFTCTTVHYHRLDRNHLQIPIISRWTNTIADRRSHTVPFWQLQQLHPFPYVPGGHGTSQLAPFQPAAHVQLPVIRSQDAELWHGQVWRHLGPNLLPQQATSRCVNSH